MEIKQQILNQLQLSNSAPFLFVGSGISKRYLDLENWEELLRGFAYKATENPFQYELYLNEIIDERQYGKLPQVAGLLEKDFTKTFLTSDDYKSMRLKNVTKIRNNISPFKIALGEHFTNINFDEANDEITLLKKLAIKNIAGIITTNYDQFIEKIFKDYTVYIGQDELIFSTIYEIGEIYKIHGCCSKPESIVITEHDYDHFIQKSDYLTAKLLTIFLEHPIVFIGYSLSDPNIRNILKSIANCVPNEKLALLKQRFIFIEFCKEQNQQISTQSISFGENSMIEMTKVSLYNYSELYQALLENRVKYNPRVLRNLKKDIYELVQSESPTEKMKVVGLENSDALDKIEIVVGVGILNEYGSKGYASITAVDLYKDIILNENNYDHQLIVEKTLPNLLKGNTGGLPMFKFLATYTGKLSDELLHESNRTFDSFWNRSLRETKNKKRSTEVDFKTTIDIENEEITQIIQKFLLLNQEEFDIIVLHKFLKATIDNNCDIFTSKHATNFKRLIRIYDYLKNKKPLSDEE